MRLGRIILLVALILAVALAAVWFLFLRGGATGGTSQVDMEATQAALQNVTVVVLSQPVNKGEVLDETKLALRQLPKESVVEGSTFEAFSDVIGRTVRFDLPANTFLNEGMLVGGAGDQSIEQSFQGSDHAWLIGSGMVAFPVPISRFSSVAYGLTRGDYVDVIVTMSFVDLDTQFQTVTPNQTAGVLTPGGSLLLDEPGPGASLAIGGELGFNNIVAQAGDGGPLSIQGRAELDALLDQPFYYVPSEAQRPRVVSQRVFQNLAVLQVGTFPVYDEQGREAVVATPTPVPAQPVAEGEEAPPPEVPTTPPPDIVTLIMWPQEAVTLNYLLHTGAQLTLALRGANSVSEPRTDTDAVTLQYLMDVYRIPLPVRLPYGTTPRIDRLAPPVLENDVTIEGVIIQ